MFHPGATEFQSGQYALLYLPRAPESPKAIRVPAIHGLAIVALIAGATLGDNGCWHCQEFPAMGFEQLAALRAQLASAKAAAEPATPPASSLTVGMGPPSRRPPAPALSVGAVIGRLQQRFPEAFPRKPAPKLPLKVGILADLAAQAGALGLTEDQLRAALAPGAGGSATGPVLPRARAGRSHGAAAGTVTEQEVAWAHQPAHAARRSTQEPARNGDAPSSDAG